MRLVLCVPCDAPISAGMRFGVYFCQGKKEVTIDHKDLEHVLDWAREVTRTPEGSLNQENVFANALKYALMFHDDPDVQAIGQSVWHHKSFVYMRFAQQDTWTRLSMEGNRNFKDRKFSNLTHVIVAKQEGVWAAPRVHGRRVTSMLPRNFFDAVIY
eukprot:GHVU01138797.1.p1 GENE.GHVU01138797.1~~GHVU01138797.1.p1  ORF type:complete len:157 (+),score=13.01 GHVU01138797.1:206-676(+)